MQQRIDKIDSELEERLAAARAEGAEESSRRIAAVKEAGAFRLVQCERGGGKYECVDNSRESEIDWGYNDYGLQGECMRCTALLGVR